MGEVVALLVIAVLAAAVWIWIRRITSRRAPTEEAANRLPVEVEVRFPMQVEVRVVGHSGRPPPRPASPEEGAGGDAVWIPEGRPTTIRGYQIPGGMIYVGTHMPCAAGYRAVDPALINPRLPVDPRSSARFGEGMGYWPSYSEISPECRAAYLDWLAGHRRDPGAYIGYVFLFFYGLERRALVDRQDLPGIRAEVRRLLGIYFGSNSFRGYATSFLATTAPADRASMSEQALRDEFGPLVEDDPLALAAVLAWYHERRRPLPVDFALAVAARMEDAKRSVVATRCRAELFGLFGLRYRERFGEGMILEAAPRPVAVPYRPASAGLAALGRSAHVVLPDVLGRRRQFKPLVAMWNGGIEDLKRFAAAQRKGAGESGDLTPAMWEAMPTDLRTQYDHPDRERWEATVLASERCGSGHLLTALELAALSHLPAKERYAAGQLHKVADTAAHMGFVVEPEPRAGNAGAAAAACFVVWRSRVLDPPDPRLYGPASTVLRLAMSVAMADGELHEQEIRKVTEMTETLFVLDEAMRERMRMLRDLLGRHPAKLGGLARRLAETRTPEQRRAIARLLVAIAAADGVLQPEEHKALRGLYRALRLAEADLDGALAGFGSSIASDQPVVVVPPTQTAPGSAVRAPDEVPPRGVTLDPRMIDTVLADTREVAALLADVFESDDEEMPVESVPSPAPAPTVDRRLAACGLSNGLLEGLDPGARLVLADLLVRQEWTAVEVRDICRRHKVMSTAALDAINTWSDETLRDYLVVDDGSWKIRTELIRRSQQ